MAKLNSGCLTCIQPTGLDFLNVLSADNTSIAEALRKHFWFTEVDLQLAFICRSCWNQVDNFHKFYVSVEELCHSRAASAGSAGGKPIEDNSGLKVGLPEDAADECMAEGLPVESVEMYQNLRLELSDCMVERPPEVCSEMSDIKNEQLECSAIAQEQDDGGDKSDSEYTTTTKKRRLVDQTSNEVCQMKDAHIEEVEKIQEEDDESDDKPIAEFIGLTKKRSLIEIKSDELCQIKDAHAGGVNKDEEMDDESDDKTVSEYIGMTKDKPPMELKSEELCQMKDAHIEEADKQQKEDDEANDKGDSECTPKIPLTEPKSDEMSQIKDAQIEGVDDKAESKESVVLELSNDKLESKLVPVEEPLQNHAATMITESKAIKNNAGNQEDEDYIRTLVKYICEQCGHGSPTFSAFRMHSQHEHGNTTPFSMGCETKYVRKLYLMKDVQQECEKKFKNKEGFEHQTEEIHTSDEQMFGCDRCPRTYTSKLTLEKHMEDHAIWDAKKWKCTECDKTLTDGLSVGAHILNCWSGASSCEICRLILPSKVALEAHNCQGHGSLEQKILDSPQSEKLEVIEKPHIAKKDVACSCNLPIVENISLGTPTVVKENTAGTAEKEREEPVLVVEPISLGSSNVTNERPTEIAVELIKEKCEEPVANAETIILGTSNEVKKNVAKTTAELIKEKREEPAAIVETISLRTSNETKESSAESAVELIKKEREKLEAIVQTSILGTSTALKENMVETTVELIKEKREEPVPPAETSSLATTPVAKERTAETTVEQVKKEGDSEQSDDDQADEDHDDSEHTSRKRKRNSDESKSTFQMLRQKDDDYIRTHVKFICNECNKDCPTFYGYMEHARVAHGNLSPSVLCCGRKFVKKYLLLFHVQLLNNPAAFRCEECAKNYTGQDGLQRHIKKCHKDNTFKCEYCSKTFPTASLLKTHSEFHTDNGDERWKCASCMKFFHSSYSLTRHINRLHPDWPEYKCNVCSKTFRLEVLFDQHKTTHTSLQCPRCSLVVKDMDSLRNHARVMHPNAKLCMTCIQIFPTEAALQAHKVQEHGESLITRRSQATDDDECEEEGLTACSAEKPKDDSPNESSGMVTRNSRSVETKESKSVEEPTPNGLTSTIIKSDTEASENDGLKEGKPEGP